VSGAIEALLWEPQIYNYTIETVYLLVDAKNGTTQTVTTVPNSKTEDDWLSISSSVEASMAGHGFAGAGIANDTTAIQHVTRFWEAKDFDLVTLYVKPHPIYLALLA